MINFEKTLSSSNVTYIPMIVTLGIIHLLLSLGLITLNSKHLVTYENILIINYLGGTDIQTSGKTLSFVTNMEETFC
jgi:hypothetical protein